MGAPFRLTERQRTNYCYQGDWVLLFLEGRLDYSTPLKDHAIWIKNQGKERERCSEVSLQHRDGACFRTVRKTGSPKTHGTKTPLTALLQLKDSSSFLVYTPGDIIIIWCQLFSKWPVRVSRCWLQTSLSLGPAGKATGPIDVHHSFACTAVSKQKALRKTLGSNLSASDKVW